MRRAWRLEDFDDAAAQPAARMAAPALSEAALEDERLAAFDKGYKAGWDDATAAHETDQARITAEFAHNLQAMSFTYHEARSAVLAEMEGLLRGMVDTVLPGALQPALGAMILERAELAMRSAAAIPAEIVVAPASRPRLEALLEGRVAPPLQIREEPSLGEGQAFLRFGATEEKLDLDGVLAEMRAAIDEFFTQPEAPIEEGHRHVG